jgi:hypothetical protein
MQLFHDHRRIFTLRFSRDLTHSHGYSLIANITQVGDLARKWYSASRQCLYAGGFEAKACLTQLQTFLITQPYWIGTNDMETMNS